VSRAKELALFASSALRKRIPANLQLTVAMGTAEARSVEEEAVCRHPLHEVDTLAAEVAEVTGVSRRRLESQGSRGDVTSEFRGRVVGSGALQEENKGGHLLILYFTSE
jgi:hypothetical protein